ncbi:MAG: hypothetical protein ACM3X5_03560 [Bacillota bacterium]
MERMMMKLAIAAAALAAVQAMAAQGDIKPVVVYTDGLPPNVAEQVKKHAAEGEASLMRYLEATQKQNGLRMEDVTKRMKKAREGGPFEIGSPRPRG